MSIATHITSGFSSLPMINWLRNNTPLKLILEGIGREIYPEINMWVLGKNIIEKIDKDYNLSLKYTTEIFKNTIKNGYQKLLNFNGNKNAVNIVNYKKEFSTLIFYIKLIVNSYQETLMQFIF